MTIRTRIVLFSTIVFAVVICGFGLLLERSVRAEELAKLDARLSSHADKVATELEEEEHEQPFPDVKSFLELRTDGLPDVHIQVFDSTGTPLLPTSDNSPRWEKELGTHSSDLDGHTFRILNLSSEPENRNVYRIQVSSVASEMEERLSVLHRFLLAGIPFSILLTALGASIIVRSAFKPISAMATTASGISGQNLNERVPEPKSDDEVRQLALTLNQMIARLEASFAAQKQFIADSSHEIRTPLTVINAELEYLQTKVQDPELRESLKTGLHEVDRLVRLSNNLLLLARLDSDREPVQHINVRMDELLAGCISRAKSLAADKSISICLLIQESVEIVTDPDKCTIVVMNLLDNAIKYSGPGSTVTVELRSDQVQEKVHVQVIVADQGPGIPSSSLKNIFDRFYRVDQSRSAVRGTGLGLAIVQRLTNLIGGSIEVTSAHPSSPNRAAGSPTGTTFTINLPVSRP